MKLLKTLVVGVLVLSMSACDGFFDINQDPDAASEVPGGLLFPTMLASWGSNRSMEGGQYTNYFSQTFSSNNILANWWWAENYDLSATAVNNHWLAYYGTVQRNAELGIQSALSGTPVRTNEAAQFMILSALNYYEASLLWEDVPFHEANQPVEFPTPRYDSQQEVFNGVIAQINEALAMIDVNAPAVPQIAVLPSQDVVYGTITGLPVTTPAAQRMQNWVRFANAVKLHVYMSLRGGGQNVDAEIQQLINLSNTEMLREATRNAYIPFNNVSKNPLGRMQEVYAGSPNWFWSGKPVTDIMNETNDPRRPIYMLPAESDGAFRNAPAGSGVGLTQGSRTRRDTYLSNSMPVPLMYAHEVLFLEAEWLAEQNRLGDADAKFREGIRQAFAALPARAVGASVPAAAQAAFIAQFPDLATLSREEALRLIWRQHYVGLHGDGIQSWTLVRRVGEPVFGLNYPPSPQGGLTSWISRWPYQVNEVAANPNAPQENPPLDRNMWFQGRAQQ
jgi:hypothetical protein